MKNILLTCLFLIIFQKLFCQGLNHTWLLSYHYSSTSLEARINYTLNSDTLITEQREMPFESTQANISDENGNFLMSSNGVFIANANNVTMLNGDSLNPNSFALSNQTFGMPLPNANVILPYPGDSTKYVLFHHTVTYNGFSYPTYEIYKSVVDMTLDSGLGGVVLKNDTVLQDTLNWGFGACKHANGRDWWIVVQKQNTDIIYKFLLTPNGVQNISTQHLNVPYAWYNVTHLMFSPDGEKFAYARYDSITLNSSVFLFTFDRCSGNFSNSTIIPVTINEYIWDLVFSPNSKFLYVNSNENIYQINTDTSNIIASLNVVAINDTFYSPFPPLRTNFLLMYLAADGKIYITSGNSVVDLHYINYPDSAGIACDVHLHDLHLPCFHKRSVPNHPNYYLGCDTTGGCPCLLTGINNLTQYDFRFRIYPNPVLSASSRLNIGYLLPQNKSGLFQIYDITGKIVFKYTLPQWSNEQSFRLPMLNDGIYNCVITSDGNRVSKKLSVINE